MGYYLLDRPNPNYPQTRPRSAWGWSAPTGLVTVHTAEGALDRIAPDTGAENVANYVATRSDAGGYHELIDQDSVVQMAPDHLMTWHTAAFNLNGPGWGISAACRSEEWDPDAAWSRKIITTMGARIAEFWRRQGIDPRTAARWLTLEQVRDSGGRVVGLVQHGVVQPGDRSDAWARHPQRVRLDQMLLDAISAAAGGTTPTTTPVPEEDIMATRAELQQDLKAEADRIIAAIPKPQPVDDGRWMATYQAEGKIYVVIDGVRYHVPGGATEEETNHRLELLRLQGFDNRGVQDAALSVLPEAPFSIVAA